MRRESKSMWLRRIGPLGVAGMLVLPLAGSAADKAAPTANEKLDLYTAEKDARSANVEALEAEYKNALMLGKTAQEKLTIEQALKLAEAGKPEEALELFLACSKNQQEIELFKKLIVFRTAGTKTPSEVSPGAFDKAPAFNMEDANKTYEARENTAATLDVQMETIRGMVAQGRFKEAENAYKTLIAKLVGNEDDTKKLQELIDQCDFAAAEEAAKTLKRLEGTWVKDELCKVICDYQKLYENWSSLLMQEAQKQAKEKNYVDALSVAQRAQKLDVNRGYIKSFIEKCQKEIAASEYRKETSLENISPDYEKDQKEVDHAIREAKIFFRNKQYESAIVRLERALLVDPFNLEAVDMLTECYRRLYYDGDLRGLVTEERAEALNIWEWAEPLDRVQIDPATAKEAKVHSAVKTDVYNKLEQVVFPSVSLKDYTLVNIITYLNDKSRAYDPDHEGVTIIDNLSAQDKQRKMSIEFGKISLLDIIRYISLETGFSYSFNGNKVIFGNVDSMSTEFFPVRGDIIAEIIDSQLVKQTSSGMQSGGEGGEGGGMDGGSSLGGGLGGGMGGAGDTAGGMGGAGDAAGGMGGAGMGGAGMGGGASMSAGGAGGMGGTSLTMGANEEGAEAMASMNESQSSMAAETNRNSAALKAYFADRWITFDNGANIIYSPRGERLVVKNTPENLRRMATLLKQLDALDQPMILVEVKLIELADTNLNELGFDWLFTAYNDAGTWASYGNDTTRHGDSSGNEYQVLKNFKILPNFGEKIFGSDANVDLSLSINAVCQNNRAELLSSPRVLTKSGMATPAKIQMTEKTYFVTEWDQPDVESNGFSISMDISAPEWDLEKDLGVIFSVKPSVDSDNYTITLEDIHPIFLEHIDDEDHIVSYETGVITSAGQQPVKTFEYNMKMPTFANREIISSITLYDGETVLLGGMADNESSARSDKTPFLGDIPLLGKLFTDQKTDVSNHSMLIFITARLVNANGVPLRSSRERGMIDFNR